MKFLDYFNSITHNLWLNIIVLLLFIIFVAVYTKKNILNGKSIREYFGYSKGSKSDSSAAFFIKSIVCAVVFFVGMVGINILIEPFYDIYEISWIYALKGIIFSVLGVLIYKLWSFWVFKGKKY